MDKTRIIILQRIIPHYRTGFFKKFKREYSESEIFYGQPYKNESLKNSELNESSSFRFFKNLYFGKSGKIFISEIYNEILRYRPQIVISVFNAGNLNIYLLFILRKFLKFKIILWSFGYDPASGFNPNKKFADKLRLLLSEKADAVLFYWEKGKSEAEVFAKNKSHFFVAPNTLDTETLFSLKKSFDEKGIGILKKELGIIEKHHFVYTGRLLKDKQADILIRAFGKLEEKNPDCRLSIIGDGPESDYLRKLSEDLNTRNVKFLGEILDEETVGKWIYVSDAFVMPGRLGLSVVHSFCFATPVISQKKETYYHGEGVGYIKDGFNGFLVEDGNTDKMAGIMNEIISVPGLSSKLKQNAFDTAINDCSLEKMLGGFNKAISHVLNKK